MGYTERLYIQLVTDNWSKRIVYLAGQWHDWTIKDGGVYVFDSSGRTIGFYNLNHVARVEVRPEHPIQSLEFEEDE